MTPLRVRLQRFRPAVDNGVNGYKRWQSGLLLKDDFIGLDNWIPSGGAGWTPLAGILVANSGEDFGGLTPPGHAHLRLIALGSALTDICLQLDTLQQMVASFPGWQNVTVRATSGAAKQVGFDDEGGAALDTQKHVCAIGDIDGNARVALGSNQMNDETWCATKLEILQTGDVRAWASQPDSTAILAVLANAAGQAVPPTFRVEIMHKNDANDRTAQSSSRRFVAMRRNDITLTGIANASATVNVSGGADVPVAFNAGGRALLAMGGYKYPVSIRYRFKDTLGVEQADLTIPVSYGGDTVGLFLPTPINPASFALSLDSSGLLFSNTAGANGALPAGFTVESGNWDYNGNAVRCLTTAGAESRCIVSGAGSRKNWHTQMLAMRTLTNNYASVFQRYSTELALDRWYLGDIRASGDADANKTSVYRRTAGVYTKLGVGGAGLAANVQYRYNFSTIDSEIKFWKDGADLLSFVDAVNVNDGAVCLDAFGIGGPATVTFSQIHCCKERLIHCINLPDGWKIRVNGVDSAGAVAGIASVDVAGAAMPFADIRVLDLTGAVVKTLTPGAGVFCGDIYKVV